MRHHISGLYSLKTLAGRPLAPEQTYLAPLQELEKYSGGGMSYCGSSTTIGFIDEKNTFLNGKKMLQIKNGCTISNIYTE
jgi:hypothetical protein